MVVVGEDLVVANFGLHDGVALIKEVLVLLNGGEIVGV